MKPVLIISCMAVFVLSCQGPTGQGSSGEAVHTVVIKAPEVPVTRSETRRSPVAVYREKIAGNTLVGDFVVKVFETKKTFAYRMNIQYAAVTVDDTLKLPNLGVMPAPVLKKGPTENSCIAGFLDDKKQFHEYKLVSVTHQKISIKVLKHYAVATYTTR